MKTMKLDSSIDLHFSLLHQNFHFVSFVVTTMNLRDGSSMAFPFASDSNNEKGGKSQTQQVHVGSARQDCTPVTISVHERKSITKLSFPKGLDGLSRRINVYTKMLHHKGHIFIDSDYRCSEVSMMHLKVAFSSTCGAYF